MNANELYNRFNEYKVGFVSLKNYRNNHGEISDILLTIGFNYGKMKQKDIKTLSEGIEVVSSDKYTANDWALALSEKLQSLVSPNEARSKGQTDAYVNLTENGTLKLHLESGSLKIIGVVVRKTIKENGVYPVVNSKPKTLAKKEIEKQLKTSQIRYYTIDLGKVSNITFNGTSLEIEI